MTSTVGHLLIALGALIGFLGGEIRQRLHKDTAPSRSSAGECLMVNRWNVWRILTGSGAIGCSVEN